MHKEQLQHLSKLLDQIRERKPRVYRKVEHSIQRIINKLVREQ